MTRGVAMTSTDEVPDADAALVAGKQPPSARIPLDRDRIITAAITNESAEELKLAAGQTAYAVIKASDVMVGVD